MSAHPTEARRRPAAPSRLPTRLRHQHFDTGERFRGDFLRPAAQVPTEDLKEMFKTRTPRALALAFALLAAPLPSSPRAATPAPDDDKMKAEDVIAKHLEALGPQ